MEGQISTSNRLSIFQDRLSLEYQDVDQSCLWWYNCFAQGDNCECIKAIELQMGQETTA